VNFSFVEREWETDFAGNADPITVLNPIASQMSVMRSQIIGNLVDILKFNLNRKADRVNVFELGRIFRRDASVKGSDSSVQGVFQPLHIAALSYGSAFPKQWGEKDRLVDFYDLKGKLEELIFPLKARFEVLQHPALHPGRSAKVIIGGEEVGFIGELHPKLLSKYGLVHAPIVFELAVEPLLNLSVPAARAVPKHQVVERDLSVLIDNKVPVQMLLDAVHKAQKKDPRLLILDSFELFDLYRPKDAEENARKSLAFTVKLQGLEDAVTDEQADNAIKALLEILEAQGAELRK
jgi:phenylalanyl-tRNA synthetase beta chain